MLTWARVCFFFAVCLSFLKRILGLNLIMNAPGTYTSAQIYRVVKSSPIMRSPQWVGSGVTYNAKTWADAGNALAESLSLPPETANYTSKQRMFGFYLPVLFWIKARVADRARLAVNHEAIVVGISAPQGCGKTTLTTHMKKVLGLQGVRCAALSLDSFYLTGKEQDAFAAAHSNNSLLQTRGNAGTHDLKLAMETLDKLKSAKAGETVRVPVYDKSLRCGKGDRLPEEKWDTETGPLDVILLEGWMMGFTPLAPAGPSADDSGSAFTSSKLGAEMKEADQLLQQYKGLFAACSCWIVIRIAELSWVYRWRLQAEQSMRSRCGSGMSDDEVQRFVSLYMPAYTAYLPGLYRAPWGSQGKPVLMARVDKHRNPV